jgi:hypothetical protein
VIRWEGTSQVIQSKAETRTRAGRRRRLARRPPEAPDRRSQLTRRGGLGGTLWRLGIRVPKRPPLAPPGHQPELARPARAPLPPHRGGMLDTLPRRQVGSAGHFCLRDCRRRCGTHARSMPDPDTIVDVQTLLSRSGPVERSLVEKWFGLDGGEVWSLKQLAAEYRSSPDNVRLMLERALATLRRCAGSPAVGSVQPPPSCPLPRPPTWS